MIAAAIDIGTNSIKLVVGENEARGAVRLLREDGIITRLGENLDSTGLISDAAFRRTLEALRSLVADARDLGAECIRAVATSAMRDAASTNRRVLPIPASPTIRATLGAVLTADCSMKAVSRAISSSRPQ